MIIEVLRVKVLHLDQIPLISISLILLEVLEPNGVGALQSLVANLIAFVDFLAAAFADNLQVEAFVELVGSQDKFLVSQLIRALLVVASKSYLA